MLLLFLEGTALEEAAFSKASLFRENAGNTNQQTRSACSRPICPKGALWEPDWNLHPFCFQSRVYWQAFFELRI